MRLLRRAQRSKHLLLLRLVVVTAARTGHAQAAELANAYDLLAGAQTDRPSEVDPLLRHPPVGAWAIQALCDVWRGATVDHGYLAALAAAAALLARADCAVEVPLHGGRVFLPFLGTAHLTVRDAPRTAIVRSGPQGGEIRAAGAQLPIPANPQHDDGSWWGIRRLTVHAAGPATSFLLDDLDPYRLPGARTAGHLDAVALGQWHRILSDAWALLVANHPETAEEIAAGVAVLVPLHAPPGCQVSATSRHSFGAVALSQPQHGRSFAAALAHERQHVKLGALLDLVSLIDHPSRTRWYAPWRDDPRPLGALLQGAYAHLGVTAFWRQQRHIDRGKAALRAHMEFARWRDETRDVVATLQTSGALTRCGSRFVDGMAASLDTWAEEPIPAVAVQQAQAVATSHRRTWRLRHGPIESTTSPQK
ncbi:MAG: HEXXH motif domain-containing protein [Actinomycetota bacterium]|nr:HEXXH motif domain-containing protein [Actinomycetota bacterium]